MSERPQSLTFRGVTAREEFIARCRHLVWLGYQIAVGQEHNLEPTLDQLQSLIYGVQYAEKHPDLTAEENHQSWMNAKRLQGWKYGPVKDPERKEHPDLVPYSELPEVERRKDDMDIAAQRAASLLWEHLTEDTSQDLILIETALLDAISFHQHRDEMKASLHLQGVRYSPLTEKLQFAHDAVLAVRRWRGF